MSTVIKTKQSSSGVMNEPKIPAARQMKKNHDFFPDDAEEFDAVVQNARKKMEIPVELAMPCVTRVRIPTAKAPTQKVAVSKEGEGTRSIERRATLSDKKRKANKSVRIPEVSSSLRAKPFA